MTYVEPSYLSPSFVCPHCEVLTAQTWADGISQPSGPSEVGFTTAVCQSAECGEFTVWVGRTEFNGIRWRLIDPKLVYPPVRFGPEPNPDLDVDIQKDFNEARDVLSVSPRAAAALLRLALQKLMTQLGKPGKDINADIAALVEDGLRADIQQALDVVRVTGNEAVHPGRIDTDDRAVVLGLFNLVNLIADDRISQPKRIAEIYGALPEEKRNQIEQRDGGGTVDM